MNEGVLSLLARYTDLRFSVPGHPSAATLQQEARALSGRMQYADRSTRHRDTTGGSGWPDIARLVATVDHLMQALTSAGVLNDSNWEQTQEDPPLSDEDFSELSDV